MPRAPLHHSNSHCLESRSVLEPLSMLIAASSLPEQLWDTLCPLPCTTTPPASTAEAGSSGHLGAAPGLPCVLWDCLVSLQDMNFCDTYKQTFHLNVLGFLLLWKARNWAPALWQSQSTCNQPWPCLHDSASPLGRKGRPRLALAGRMSKT